MKKLHGNDGETIGEMLVSSLIIALAIVMLVTMVNISTKLVRNSADNRTNAFDAVNTAETEGNSGGKDSKVTIQIEPDTQKHSNEAGGPDGSFQYDVKTDPVSLTGNKKAVTYQKVQGNP